MFVIASVPDAESISEQDLHPVSLQGASRNVCVILASQNSAYQKHTAACQTSNLAFSAPQLSEQMATQDTFHISPLHGRNNQPCLENAVPCDITGVCQEARLLFIQTGKNRSLHVFSPTSL